MSSNTCHKMDVVRKIKDFIIEKAIFLHREVSILECIILWSSTYVLEEACWRHKISATKFTLKMIIIPLTLMMLFSYLLKQGVLHMKWKWTVPWIIIMLLSIKSHFQNLGLIIDHLEKNEINSFPLACFSIYFGGFTTKVYKLIKVIKVCMLLYNYRDVQFQVHFQEVYFD